MEDALTVQAPSEAVKIRTSVHAAELFAPTFSHAGFEELRVAHLDADRCLIALRRHGGGDIGRCDFPIRTIMLDALLLNSHGLLLAHNHPSGDPSPSRDDIAATRALSQVTAPLGIRIYDHIIFAESRWRSLLAMGLL